MMRNLMREDARGLRPVEWGTYGKGIRLFWGESPVAPPESVRRRVAKEAATLNLYPEPKQRELKEALASYNRIDEERILIGNGSDAIIELIAKTFIERGDEVIIPQPSFITYANVTKLVGGVPMYVDLNERFKLNIDLLIDTITERTKAVFIANPNNPTGNYLIDEEGVRRVLSVFNGALVFTVRQKGCACHAGSYSCFGERTFTAEDLYRIVQDRVRSQTAGSYTAKLVRDDALLGEKLIEEAREVVSFKDRENLIWELADLTYFTMVIMAKNGVTPDEVMSELQRRRR